MTLATSEPDWKLLLNASSSGLRIACWRLEKIIPAKGHVRKRNPGVVLCEPCENIWSRGCERRFHNWCSARMKREWRVNCPFRLFFSFHQHKLFLKKLVSFHLRKLFLSERVYKIFHQNKQSSPHYDRIKKNIYKRSPASCNNGCSAVATFLWNSSILSVIREGVI